MEVIDDIIKEREDKINKMVQNIISLDEELFNMYKELEYFKEKRRCDR